MSTKLERYKRVEEQLQALLVKTTDPISRMATIAALLHSKFHYFSWIGFYRLVEDELIVGPYQGLLACMILKKTTGVCWASIDQNRSIIVPDVHKFDGHIACDSRSNSEIVIPLKNEKGTIVGVMDVDSTELNSFDIDDEKGLSKITEMVYKKLI